MPLLIGGVPAADWNASGLGGGTLRDPDWSALIGVCDGNGGFPCDGSLADDPVGSNHNALIQFGSPDGTSSVGRVKLNMRSVLRDDWRMSFRSVVGPS